MLEPRRAKQNKELVLELSAPCPLVTLELLKITLGWALLIHPDFDHQKGTLMVIDASFPLGGGRVLSGV